MSLADRYQWLFRKSPALSVSLDEDGYFLDASDAWLARFGFIERAGDRWWPIAGGVYYLRATKHVHGMRVITPAKQRRQRRGSFVPAARARETLTTVTERGRQ